VVVGSIVTNYSSAVFCAVLTQDGSAKNEFTERNDDTVSTSGKRAYEKRDQGEESYWTVLICESHFFQGLDLIRACENPNFKINGNLAFIYTRESGDMYAIAPSWACCCYGICSWLLPSFKFRYLALGEKEYPISKCYRSSRLQSPASTKGDLGRSCSSALAFYTNDNSELFSYSRPLKSEISVFIYICLCLSIIRAPYFPPTLS
jgi:hypothetical protein